MRRKMSPKSSSCDAAEMARERVERSMESQAPPQPLPVPTPATTSRAATRPVSSQSPVAPVAPVQLPQSPVGTPRSPAAEQREQATTTTPREAAPVQREQLPALSSRRSSVSSSPRSSPRHVPRTSSTSSTTVSALRRSTRARNPVDRLGFDASSYYVFDVADGPQAHLFYDHGLPAPCAYAASASDTDTLTYDQAMRDVERNKWIKAMQAEIEQLEAKGTWDEVPRSDATTKILPSIWVFRRKRSPDGTILKYKARFCVQGQHQEGEFETFAPVSLGAPCVCSLFWR